MNRHVAIALLGLASLTMAGCQSVGDTGSRPLFGVDNRMEMVEAGPSECLAGSAVFAVLPSTSLQRSNASDWSLAEKRTLADAGWCSNQRFARQPVAAICTAFLISPIHLATAGHCINDQGFPAGPGLNCNETVFVLDFKLGIDGTLPESLQPDQVYHCSEVVAGQDSRIGPDWRVVKLDRLVPRSPLPVYSGSPLSDAPELHVVGHPHGLPMKSADEGQILGFSSGRYLTNLDTFRGNSGSPVYIINDGAPLVIALMSGGMPDKANTRSAQDCHTERICTDSDSCTGQLATHSGPLAAWATHSLPAMSDDSLMQPDSRCIWCADPLRSRHWQCPLSGTQE